MVTLLLSLISLHLISSDAGGSIAVSLMKTKRKGNKRQDMRGKIHNNEFHLAPITTLQLQNPRLHMGGLA